MTACPRKLVCRWHSCTRLLLCARLAGALQRAWLRACELPSLWQQQSYPHPNPLLQLSDGAQVQGPRL